MMRLSALGKRIACSFALMFSVMSIGPALAAPGDNITTASKPISEVMVQTDGTSSYYYFRAGGGWEVPNCSGVALVYISASDPGADAVLSAALTARSSERPVSFSGICGDVNGNTHYVQIRGIFF